MQSESSIIIEDIQRKRPIIGRLQSYCILQDQAFQSLFLLKSFKDNFQINRILHVVAVPRQISCCNKLAENGGFMEKISLSTHTNGKTYIYIIIYSVFIISSSGIPKNFIIYIISRGID